MVFMLNITTNHAITYTNYILNKSEANLMKMSKKSVTFTSITLLKKKNGLRPVFLALECCFVY